MMRAASSQETTERVYSCNEEREEGFHRGVRTRCETVSTGSKDRGRLEVLAYPTGHEQVLVAIRIEESGMVLAEPDRKCEREQRNRRERRKDNGAPHVDVRRNRARSERKPAVSAVR